jgi:hypothetical protein
MPELDNIDSLGTGTQAMKMVPVVTQVHGNTEASKVVIDVEKEAETVEKKQIASRSEFWQHFDKIKDEK